MIGMIGRYHSDQREIPDKKGFCRRQPQDRFFIETSLLPPPRPYRQNFLKAPLRGAESAPRAARARSIRPEAKEMSSSRIFCDFCQFRCQKYPIFCSRMRSHTMISSRMSPSYSAATAVASNLASHRSTIMRKSRKLPFSGSFDSKSRR